MNRKTLYSVWGGLFIVCAGLGFIHEPTGFLKALMVMLSLAHFVPGCILIVKGEKQDLRQVRNLSIGSLTATLVFLIANFLSYASTVAMGNVLYGFLVVVSSPMVCSQYWALSLFFWACLMISSISKLRKLKKVPEA